MQHLFSHFWNTILTEDIVKNSATFRPLFSNFWISGSPTTRAIFLLEICANQHQNLVNSNGFAKLLSSSINLFPKYWVETKLTNFEHEWILRAITPLQIATTLLPNSPNLVLLNNNRAHAKFCQIPSIYSHDNSQIPILRSRVTTMIIIGKFYSQFYP